MVDELLNSIVRRQKLGEFMLEPSSVIFGIRSDFEICCRFVRAVVVDAEFKGNPDYK